MIALCDQRSFYSSCETVFRPDIRNKPVLVLSNNDGCVVALNESAKAVGAIKFKPYFQQKALLLKNKVHVFSSNYALYGEISSRIMATLKSETPNVEIYSIDEGFCDLTGIALTEIPMLAAHLRDKIWQEQRIPMGVSIAPTKTLAKLGQYATKKIPKINGICILQRPNQWEWLAARMPVSEVWGVGRKLTIKLNFIGVITALDLLKLPLDVAKSLAGVSLVRTVRELNGEECINMELSPPDKQQIICSRSFGKKITDLDDIKQAVSVFASRASEKLRSQHCRAGRLSVWLQTGITDVNYYNDSFSETIAGGTDDARVLSELSTLIVDRLYQDGVRYGKAGIALIDIRPKQFWQYDLLNQDKPSTQEMMNIVDKVNARYGRGTLVLARAAREQKFKMKQLMLSPQYLTQWNDIPVILCR